MLLAWVQAQPRYGCLPAAATVCPGVAQPDLAGLSAPVTAAGTCLLQTVPQQLLRQQHWHTEGPAGALGFAPATTGMDRGNVG
jgi:hypothetical protein